MALFQSHFLPWSHVLPNHLPSPVSLSFRAEEELGLGALRAVQQEEAEEVFVRPVELHFALLPADGGEGRVVKHQEAAALSGPRQQQTVVEEVQVDRTCVQLPSQPWGDAELQSGQLSTLHQPAGLRDEREYLQGARRQRRWCHRQDK